MEHKQGLVLSGGAAFGAFQIGALQAAKQLGYIKWDLIAGVSVGALNGTMIALDKFKVVINFSCLRAAYLPASRLLSGIVCDVF